MATPIQRYVAEFVGTFALTFVGILAIFHLGDVTGGLVGIALAHGLVIAVMVSATGAISGGHLNPAVTLGLLAAGKITPPHALGYLGAQVASGFAAALLLMPLLGDAPREAIAAGTPYTDPETLSLGAAILLEAILTFFLVFVVYGTAVDRRAPQVGGLFIGLTIVLDILAGGPLTGAAMNPARQTGAAIVSGDAKVIGQVWLYWVGPVLGGVVAALLWRYVLEPADTDA